jgi:hypothetical protein
MERVSFRLGRTDTPVLAEFFDLIGETSTGG